MDSVKVVGNVLDEVAASGVGISFMYLPVVFINFDVDSAVSNHVVEVCLMMGSMVVIRSVVVFVDASIGFVCPWNPFVC